jgi:hypothetical protein
VARDPDGARSTPSIDETIDRLYSLDPDEFTKERNEAAKLLRADGDRSGSDLVKSLKRPTTAAWAVNQASRRRQDLVRELLDAGTALRAAQRAALSGSHRGDLREATQRRRAAVASLGDEAATVLEEAGRTAAPHADDIRSTLEAASADEDVGAAAVHADVTAALDDQIAAASGRRTDHTRTSGVRADRGPVVAEQRFQLARDGQDARR